MRIARGISIANTSKPISTAAAFDADAVAFFTAASITDATQKSAVNQLVLDLKSASIWTKMKAIYPVVGGVASSHAVNLKTPGTYNLSFATGWSHASTGMTPNGATYANSFIALNSVLGVNKPHLSIYIRTDTNTGSDQIDLGVSDGSNFCWLSSWYNGSGFSNVLARNTSSSVLLNGGSTSTSKGFFMTSKISNTSKIYKNNLTLTSATDTGNNPTTYGVFLGALNSTGSGSLYSNRQISFSSIGDGLTDAEASSFYTAVQNYQTTLGRQV